MYFVAKIIVNLLWSTEALFVIYSIRDCFILSKFKLESMNRILFGRCAIVKYECAIEQVNGAPISLKNIENNVQGKLVE